MKKLMTLLGAALLLASCGADGEPVPPSLNANVAITPNGVSPVLGVNTAVGPIGVRLGL